MNDAPDAALESRTTPVQQRGQARVGALLDAAADIVEEGGIAAMTTSAIAERSGSSVGVVYRYFPNADAVLIALAERNLELFRQRVTTEIDERLPSTWRDFTAMCIDSYADLARSVPAFRMVRFGDVVLMRLAQRDLANNDLIGRACGEHLVAHYGFVETPELAFRTQVAMESVDAVVRRAFLRDRNGEARFIAAAKQLIVCTLEPVAPDAAAIAAPTIVS